VYAIEYAAFNRVAISWTNAWLPVAPLAAAVVSQEVAVAMDTHAANPATIRRTGPEPAPNGVGRGRMDRPGRVSAGTDPIWPVALCAGKLIVGIAR
jgi:hypothetical protein